MALQGDLNSFALPEVLRLLAGTDKSGVLAVSGATGAGEILLSEGAIASASASTAPRADDPADVLHELLRFDGGSFAFEERNVGDAGLQADVEVTIGAAEALVEEWIQIEMVVPTMAAWLTLAPELGADEVTMSADRWRVLVAIGSGGSVADLAGDLDCSALETSRLVVDLVEADFVEVRAADGYQPPEVQLDDFEQFEDTLADPITDLEGLGAEDRAVVMEESDDALLPEPLPGEGVAYEGETIRGVVDGRVSGPDDLEPFDSLASFEAAAAMSDLVGEPGTIDGFGDEDSNAPADLVDADVEPHNAEELGDEAGDPEVAVDGERDSLLKFLSSVKP